MIKNIIVTGGSGRFAKVLKKTKSKYNFIFRNKKQLNILSEKSINRNLKYFKPDCILHLAGLSRPMTIHDKLLNKSSSIADSRLLILLTYNTFPFFNAGSSSKFCSSGKITNEGICAIIASNTIVE